MDYQEAIALAKSGKEEGFRFLYEATHQSKYYLAVQYMKNEEEAKDVLQDAYIRAFSRLDSLQQPDAFPGWFGRIVANTAKNRLVKNKPMLFTEMNQNEDAEEFERSIEDENISIQPELAYMQQERNALVHELIDSLSTEQRMCILMFYMEGDSIRQIASALGCSENTVKSRLNYGRKNLNQIGTAPEKGLLPVWHRSASAADLFASRASVRAVWKQRICSGGTGNSGQSIRRSADTPYHRRRIGNAICGENRRKCRGKIGGKKRILAHSGRKSNGDFPWRMRCRRHDLWRGSLDPKPS